MRQLNNIAQSFACALAGVQYAIRSQRNMRIHGVAALLAVMTGCLTAITRMEWLILILTIAAVIVAELFNTALEALVDIVSPEYHPLAKAAKDAAAGAVLVAAAASLIIGGIIFYPPLVLLLC